MLQLVNVGQKSLADYATIVSRGLMEFGLREPGVWRVRLG